MAAAAVSSLACPLRRSTRLAHAHSHPHPHPNAHPRQHHRLKSHHPRHSSSRPTPDPDPDQDSSSSSSDPENELTPRALRALKRQRLALDLDGLPFAARPRPRKRRKQSFPPQRPSSSPLSLRRPSSDSPHSTATTTHVVSLSPLDAASVENDNRPLSPSSMPHKEPSADPLPPKPELSIPLHPAPSYPDPPSSPEPLTPLTPLTPSPEPSPSLPGHDRQGLPLFPPHDPLPPPVSLDLTLPSPDASPSPQSLSTDSFSSSPPSAPPSLDPTLDTLIPFEGLPPFASELSAQIPPSSCQPTTPQLQGLELQEQFHSFPQHQLYVPPNPVFVRDREINIWKLACQERVDCLLRRYGIDYIKALVESEARSVSKEPHLSTSLPSTPTQLGSPPASQTKFRLYTPASYTYSTTSWGSPSATRKIPIDEDDVDPAWPMDDADWVDADVDMEDEDDDEYEDDDYPGEGEAERDGEATLEAVEGLVISEAPTPPVSKVDTQAAVAMAVDSVPGKSDMMQVDEPRLATKQTASSDTSISAADTSHRPLTPHAYTAHSLGIPPSLPPLSSLHVPLLSEPPRAFMGRGTPPDRRRLIEWSGSGRFATNGMGPPLYLSPAPQRHTSPDVGIVPMSVDPPVSPSQPPPHAPGEWTSFLYSMLGGDGVGTNVGEAPHASEPTWYELGLSSVSPVVPENALELPLSHSHPHTRTQAVERPVEDGSNSSSTLRFALG